jgi:hypothetical protein
MADWGPPYEGDYLWQGVYGVGFANGGANTWQEAVAALPGPAQMLKVFVQPADGSGGMGVQVGVGAVGSEVVVLDGLNFGTFTYQPFGDIWYELIASTPRPFTRAIVPIFTYANGFDYYAPFYLAIGAAGSELALTSDDLIARTYNGNNYGGGLGYPNSVGPSWFQMNIDVPAGSRLSAKTYSAGNGSSGIVIYASLILL